MSRQSISSKNKEKIYKLLESGIEIGELFDLIDIPIHHHWYELKNDNTYSNKISEILNNKYNFIKYKFLIQYIKNDFDLKKTKGEFDFKRISSSFKKDEEFLFLFEKIKKPEHKISNKISKYSLPNNLKFVNTNKNNSRLYNSSKKLVGKYCFKCSGYYDMSHFHRNKSSSDGYSNYCIICTSNELYGRDPHRRGELYRNEIIKEYNSVGNVIDRRCPKCGEMKSFREFSHLYMGIYVCDGCYVKKNNSNLVKRKIEFRNGRRIRVYDSNLNVLEKFCPSCNEMKKVEEFHVDNNNKIDGRYSKCKPCVREYQNSRLNYVKKKNKP